MGDPAGPGGTNDAEFDDGDGDDGAIEALDDDFSDLGAEFEDVVFEDLEFESTSLEVSFDDDGDLVARNEWLILTETTDVAAQMPDRFTVRNVTPLENLGLVVARVTASERTERARAEALIRESIPNALVNFNHLYETSDQKKELVLGQMPGDLVSLAQPNIDQRPKIGVIDTAVNLDHAAFQSANVITKDFVSYANERPAAHGTSIVSILVGQDEGFTGLLPDATIFSASVFIGLNDHRDSATTFANCTSDRLDD